MFFDLATIHVLTTATFNRLRELYPQGRFEVRRFRPKSSCVPTTMTPSSWRPAGWRENFGSATTS